MGTAVRPFVPVVATVCAAAVLSLASPVALALADDNELGAYLASECVACHRHDGADLGIPSIVGWRESDFAAALRAYRTGARHNQVMRSVAGTLSDDDVAALAGFFAAMKPKESTQ
jgi:cytochrome c